MRQIVDESLPKIEQLFEHKKLITGVPTGVRRHRRMTRGLQPSDLIIVAARPSMGKTSLVLNMAEHAGLERGQTVGFFSLEMSKEQLFIRLLDIGGEDRHVPAAERARSDSSEYDRLSHAISRSARRRFHRRHRRGSACSRCAPRRAG